MEPGAFTDLVNSEISQILNETSESAQYAEISGSLSDTIMVDKYKTYIERVVVDEDWKNAHLRYNGSYETTNYPKHTYKTLILRLLTKYV